MCSSWKSFTHTFKLFIDKTTCILKCQTVHVHNMVWESDQLHGHDRERGVGEEASSIFAFILCQADVNSTIVVITTSRLERKLCPMSCDSALIFPTIKRHLILYTIVQECIQSCLLPQYPSMLHLGLHDMYQPPQCGPQRRETAVVDHCNGFHDHCRHYHDGRLNVSHLHLLPEKLPQHRQVCTCVTINHKWIIRT